MKISILPNSLIFATLKATNSNTPLKNLYEKIVASWRTDVLKYFDERLASEKEFLEDIGNFVEEKTKSLPKDKKIRLTKIPKNKEELFLKIEHFHKEMGAKSFNEAHASWMDAGEKWVKELPEKHIKEQLKDRFFVMPEDRFMWRWLKSLKRFVFHVTKIPFYIANVFRKQKKELTFWNQEVNLAGVFHFHYLNEFIDRWVELEGEISREKSRLVLQVKLWEERNCINPTEPSVDVKEDWKALTSKIEVEINTWFDQTLVSFQHDLELSGTWEYQNKKVTQDELQKDLKNSVKKWDQENRNWGNTHYALFEDWRSDLELDGLQYYVAGRFQGMTKYFSEWVSTSEKNYLSRILEFLTETTRTFEKTQHKDLPKLITQTQYQIKKNLDLELIKPFQKYLSKNALLNHLDRIEHQVNARIEYLEEEFAAAKTNTFDEPLSTGEISKVSNYELISFEIQPWFEKKLDVTKNTLFVAINDLLITIGDIDDVVVFTLNTAGETLKKEDLGKTECQRIIQDGLERAVNKTKEVSEKIKDVLDAELQSLSEVFTTLEGKINELTENENVSSIRLRINKAKALQQSQEVKDKVRNFVQNTFKKATVWTTRHWTDLNSWKSRVTALLIPSASSAIPSREVSNFLNESNTIIGNLPLIYRSLYAIEPMADPFLFEGRTEELATVNTAYDQWCEGRIGSVILSGEKWSGLTSTINQLLTQRKFKHPQVRHAFQGNFTDPKELYSVFSKILEQPDLTSTQSVIDYLNTSGKKIIVLEDLQNIYVRRIHGLKALIELLEIIASTHRNVFWVTTITVYAGQYLEKCIQLSGYFSFPITLGNLSPEQISNLVIKRNRISGFKIIFEPSEQDLDNKKFNRLKEEEQQEFLRTRFFKELNSFAYSNVSMALLYWLLSTKKVDGSNIVISTFKKLDLTFLSLLSMDKIFVLHVLILHDGMTEKQVSEALSISLQKAKMLLLSMEEDGIVFMEEERYLVNLLVYRNVIQLLKSKNLIN